MKPLITLLLISFWINGLAGNDHPAGWYRENVPQKYGRGHGRLENVGTGQPLTISFHQDSLQAERFFEDSLHNQYCVEYRYTDDTSQNKYPGIWRRMQDGTWEQENHKHWIAICSIITYKGNRKTTIASNIKAIYSPVECSADSQKLWLDRLKKYLK